MGNRRQFLDLLIGSNGSGKTYTAIKIAIAYANANPLKRILFILSDDGEEKLYDIPEISLNELETFVGIAKLIIDDAEDFEFIAETYRPVKDEAGNRLQKNFNGLMICDDLGGAMNRRPKEIINFFKKRRQPNIDFLFMFHGFRADVPPAFYTYVNRIYIFRTSDNHKDTMQHLAEGKRNEFEQVYRKVQRITEHEDPHYCEEVTINHLNI